MALAALMACGSDDNNNNNGNQVKTFTVPLSPANETPACAGASSTATGSATVTIAADNSSVTVAATYSGLSSAAAAGHIHAGTATTQGGPVVLPFKAPLDSPFTQTLTAADYRTNQAGAPASFAEFVTALRAGGAGYVNFHTAACPGGEIRGEIQ